MCMPYTSAYLSTCNWTLLDVNVACILPCYGCNKITWTLGVNVASPLGMDFACISSLRLQLQLRLREHLAWTLHIFFPWMLQVLSPYGYSYVESWPERYVLYVLHLQIGFTLFLSSTSSWALISSTTLHLYDGVNFLNGITSSWQLYHYSLNPN